eukprot:5573235-Prymnesium_polylepis.1
MAAAAAAIPRRLEKRRPGHARSRGSRHARPALAASRCSGDAASRDRDCAAGLLLTTILALVSGIVSCSARADAVGSGTNCVDA